MFAPHSFPGVKPAEYDEKTHGEVLVVVQIESRPGVENVEKIANVEGLDVLFIGEFGIGILGFGMFADNSSFYRTL
jgi:4-hydroxy-2-oxoheptanedioate aldolase